MAWLRPLHHAAASSFSSRTAKRNPRMALAQEIRDELHWKVSVPGYQEVVELG